MEVPPRVVLQHVLCAAEASDDDDDSSEEAGSGQDGSDNEDVTISSDDEPDVPAAIAPQPEVCHPLLAIVCKAAHSLARGACAVQDIHFVLATHGNVTRS